MMSESPNITGTLTLCHKEIARFVNVYSQTIVAPVVTTLLFYAVFALAFGGEDRRMGDIPFMTFLAPGLIMMSMAQNAFSNTSSSLIISKIQGNIVDLLMPPLSSAELYTGFVVGGIARGMAVGVTAFAVMALFEPVAVYAPVPALVFSVLGTMMLASLGIIAGIWAVKFDHIAAVTNFVVMPLTFLSGTFYSADRLPGVWRDLAFLNPFFYMIDGFRFSLTGSGDADPLTGAAVLAAVNILLGGACYMMLRAGYKIKA